MIHRIYKYTITALVLTSIAFFATACASMGTPSGGEVDLDPPKVVSSSPGFNATRVDKGKIVIEFDENITIKNPSENIIITPPQKSFPIIQAMNKKLMVELKDSLLADMTYTIDFTDAIVDNNEGNPLENFSYSFSTGDVVDSLAVSGKVLEAHNLEPVKGIYVGLHSNLNDSAFTKNRFERISRTNESGMFTIRGVAPGKYKLYALDDTNRDYIYDNPAEAVAFMETIVEPLSEQAARTDTTYAVGKDGEKVIDTIVNVQYTRFLPDNIVLRSFKSDFQRQFLQKHERSANRLSIFMGAPTEMPIVEPLNFKADEDWAILEKTKRNDTLVYWLNDPQIMAMDTLAFRVTYPKTDSLNMAVIITDTLSFVDRTRKKDKEKKEKEEKKKKKKGEEEESEITFLGIRNNLTSSWDTHMQINLEFNEPLKDSLKTRIILQQIKDSIHTDIPFQLVKDSINPRKYTVRNRWAYGTEYMLRIDSATVHSFYGLWNNKLEQRFKVKEQDQYGQLAIRVAGIDSVPAFVELLDKSDKPIRRSRVIDNIAVFKDLNPGTYYARITLDENNNGVWDTGDYNEKRQPEMVCYSQKVFEIKANFEYDEQQDPWVIDTATLAAQKPLDITKQKPKDKDARKKQLEERDAKDQQNRDNNNNNRNSNNTQTRGRQDNNYNSDNYNPQY